MANSPKSPPVPSSAGEFPLEEALQVPGVAKPTPPKEGVSPRPEAQVLLPPPVQQVVAALFAGAGEVADFILPIAQPGQLLHGEKVLLRGVVLVGHLHPPGGKRRARLHF